MSFSAFRSSVVSPAKNRARNRLIPFSAESPLLLFKVLIVWGISLGGKTENGFCRAKSSPFNRCGFRHFPRGQRKNSEDRLRADRSFFDLEV
jgi:hypothetical protein